MRCLQSFAVLGLTQGMFNITFDVWQHDIYTYDCLKGGADLRSIFKVTRCCLILPFDKVPRRYYIYIMHICTV